MDDDHQRPTSFQRLRDLPLVGRAADWGMGPVAPSRKTKRAGARIAGLKATESVCPYCAVGCGQVVYTREGTLVDIESNPRSPLAGGERPLGDHVHRGLGLELLPLRGARGAVQDLRDPAGLLDELTRGRALGAQGALGDRIS